MKTTCQTGAFDAMGNRAAKTNNVTGSESYAFDNANRNRLKLVSAEATRRVGAGAVQSYASDADGSEKSAGPIFLYTLTDGKHTNSWDSQNRLASCATTGTNANTCDFHHGTDGLRRRMAATNAGQAAPSTITHYGYDGASAVREWGEDPLTQVSASAAQSYTSGADSDTLADGDRANAWDS